MTGWLSRLIPSRSGPQPLSARAAATMEQWQSLPDVDLARAHYETRYTVVNTEATGLDLERDRLLAVGGIAVDCGLIHLDAACYEKLDPVPAEALSALLGLAGKGPLIVFNAPFNRGMIEQALLQHLGLSHAFTWIDLYLLMPALFPERFERPVRLAEWMASFGIETFQRHHALGDAWAIAQLFLAAEARALSMGLSTAPALVEQERAYQQHLKI